MSVSLNTNVTQVANTQPVKSSETKTDDKSKFLTPTQTKVAIGTGLAALAAVGIYLATRGRSAKPAENVINDVTQNVQETKVPSEIEQLKEKVAVLRQSIKTNYQAERKGLNEDVGLRLNHHCAGYIGGNPKSEKDFDKLIRHYKEDKLDGKSLKEDNILIGNYRAKLKEKAKTLSEDLDFQYARKLKKQYYNDFMKLSQDESVLQTYIIDEVLYSKANGKTSEYLKALGLSVDDAVKMLKNPEGAYDKFKMLREKACGVVNGKRPEPKIMKQNMDSLASKHKKLGDPKIEIKELFDDMNIVAQNAKDCIYHRNSNLQLIEHLQQLKSQYKQKILELSHKTRQSAEVQELKEALAKLKELESKQGNV